MGRIGIRFAGDPVSEDMQKQYGFKPLGPADGPIKSAFFDIGPNKDRFAQIKDDYERRGPARSNLRYGYVRGPVDWAAFA